MKEHAAESSETVQLRIDEIASYGSNRQRGNLVGIQPYMTTVDYASMAAFRTKMRGYLEAAREQGWLDSRTIVVLPEYIGTWLVAANEKQSFYQLPDLESAMRALVLSRPLRFLRAWLAAQGVGRLKDALFRLKAAEMAAIYQSVFSQLAASYGVTLVAGSIVLPSPQIYGGRLIIGEGPLYNAAAVYRPDGTAHPEMVYKIHPITDELPFTAEAGLKQLPLFETPAGRLGVLICADSWYDDAYQELKVRGCDLIAVPNNLLQGNIWDKSWAGYNPGPPPADVDPLDAGRLSEGEAWLKYALAGRIGAAGASHGIHVFLHGQLWDMESDGHTILVGPNGPEQATRVAGAALINFWIH